MKKLGADDPTIAAAVDAEYEKSRRAAQHPAAAKLGTVAGTVSFAVTVAVLSLLVLAVATWFVRLSWEVVSYTWSAWPK